VAGRRYNTLSRCGNSISQTMKDNRLQQQQQQLVHNDKPATLFSAHVGPEHADNGHFPVTAAERQYFVLDPEQQ